jgi:hypothetical protein
VLSALLAVVFHYSHQSSITNVLLLYALQSLHCRDATDVMYAFHSDEAMDMFRRLPRVKGATALEPSQLTVSFRQLRKRLVDEGWFNREWKVCTQTAVQYFDNSKVISCLTACCSNA